MALFTSAQLSLWILLHVRAGQSTYRALRRHCRANVRRQRVTRLPNVFLRHDGAHTATTELHQTHGSGWWHSTLCTDVRRGNPGGPLCASSTPQSPSTGSSTSLPNLTPRGVRLTMWRQCRGPTWGVFFLSTFFSMNICLGEFENKRNRVSGFCSARSDFPNVSVDFSDRLLKVHT